MGLSGFRVSVLMTRNKQLHAVLNELIHFCEIPANTQSFVANVALRTCYERRFSPTRRS